MLHIALSQQTRQTPHVLDRLHTVREPCGKVRKQPLGMTEAPAESLGEVKDLVLPPQGNEFCQQPK